MNNAATVRNLDVDVDVVDLRAQADASMPASNITITLIIQYNLISNYDVNCDFRFREVQLGSHISYPDVAKIYQVDYLVGVSHFTKCPENRPVTV